MSARVLAFMVAVGLVLGLAGAALAASPSSVTVGPSKGSASWSGQVKFGLTASRPDSATVHVKGPGTVTISISWSLAASKLDLIVTKNGSTVASSTRLTGTSESVRISGASGTYVAEAKPKLIAKTTHYSGSASFTPPPSSGGGGGGSGGGGSGGGSGRSGGSGGSGVSGGSGGSGGSSGSGGSGGPSGSRGSGAYRGSGYFDPGVPSSYFSGYPTSNSFYPGTGYGTSTTIPGGTGTQRSVSFQPVYGSSGKGQSGEAAPVATTLPRYPSYMWLLVPLGLLTFAAAAFVVFDPAEDVLGPNGTVRRSVHAQLDRLPPYALAGFIVRSVIGVGHLGAKTAQTLGRLARRERGKR